MIVIIRDVGANEHELVQANGGRGTFVPINDNSVCVDMRMVNMIK